MKTLTTYDTLIINFMGASPFSTRLSLIVLESVLLKKPVIVTDKCAVLKSYADQLECVLSYSDFQQFEFAVNEVLKIDMTARGETILQEGKDWVKERYSWYAVKNNLMRVVEH